MNHVVVYRNLASYSAFPSIARLDDTGLVVVFREAERRRFACHIDKTSAASLVRSVDGGATWRQPETVHTSPEYGVQDPSVCQLRDGTLVASFFAWAVGAPECVPEGNAQTRQLDGEHCAWTQGTSVVRSRDRGRRWESRPTPVTSPTDRATYTSEPVVELPDGDLLIPLYGSFPGESDRALVMRSADGGGTWSDAVTVAHDPFGHVSFYEPALLALPSGKVLCMLRTHVKGEAVAGYGHYLYQSESSDCGRTWSTPRCTDIWGHPPHLLLLRDGRVLCTYGYRRPPYGIRACVSADEGSTWQVRDEIVLRSDGKGTDLGYPSSVELDDGCILTVYYMHPLDEDWGAGHAFIAGTVYRLS